HWAPPPATPGDTRALHPQGEPRHIKDSQTGLGVTHLAIADAGQDVGERARDDLDELVTLVRGRPSYEPTRHEEVNDLVREPRGGVDRREALQPLGRHSRLLEELAPRARLGRLARG